MDPQADAEFFPTPTDLADLLVERLMWHYQKVAAPQSDPLAVLEPSAGEGAFLPALAKLGEVTAIDPNFDEPEGTEAEWGRMSLEDLHEALDGDRPFDIICGNPPFSLAEAHLRLLFKMLRPKGVVGLLLRIGFLSSKGRAKFFAAFPPKHIFIFTSRPSFVWSWHCKDDVGGCGHHWFALPQEEILHCPECDNARLSAVKTDRYDYAFFVWQPDMAPNRETTLSWLNTYKNKDDDSP